MIKSMFKDVSYIIFGTFLLSLGINTFLVPIRLSSGGITTLGTVFLYLFNVPLSVTNIALNALIFIFAYKYLEKPSVIKTIAGVLFLTLFLEITSYVSAFTKDYIMCTVLGGVFVGAGIGLVLKREGSTGGSDLAGLILKKFFPYIPVHAIIFILDIAVIIISGIVFGSIEIAFYSALSMYISSKTAEIVLSVGEKSKSVFVMSEKSPEIAEIIMDKFQRGVTGINSVGMYSKKRKNMLFAVMSPKELPYVIREIKKVDSKAFVVVFETREVFGEGFKKC